MKIFRTRITCLDYKFETPPNDRPDEMWAPWFEMHSKKPPLWESIRARIWVEIAEIEDCMGKDGRSDYQKMARRREYLRGLLDVIPEEGSDVSLDAFCLGGPGHARWSVKVVELKVI